ncbi:hypothetical protein EVAR_102129_1 [Eumeta japonica]|uniref:Uncharacterized protein n=1 Tax=Eumeta variegata TaxID=151549 RepID=A0A4C1TZR2_EUMVA|nr:hypothetical protein EVAR_102129_1 [Eumeta japonica]
MSLDLIKSESATISALLRAVQEREREQRRDCYYKINLIAKSEPLAKSWVWNCGSPRLPLWGWKRSTITNTDGDDFRNPELVVLVEARDES